MVKELNHSIIIEALQDYRQDFENDKDKKHEIDCALRCLNSDLLALGCFAIHFLCKNEIIKVFPNNPEIKEIVNNLDEIDMRDLAFRVGSEYCETSYWNNLKTIFETNYL